MVEKTIDEKWKEQWKEKWLEKIGKIKDLAEIKASVKKAYQQESRFYFDDDLVQKLVDKFKEIISESKEIAAFVEIKAILHDHEGLYYYSEPVQDCEIWNLLISQIKAVINETTDVSVLTTDEFEILINDIDDNDLTKIYHNKISSAE